MGLLIADFECAGRCKVGIRAARQTATVSGWLSPLFASVLVPGGVLLVPGTYGGVQVGDDSIRICSSAKVAGLALSRSISGAHGHHSAPG